MNREEWLERKNACDAGAAYLLSYRTNQKAWEQCERPDWMGWFWLAAVGDLPESQPMMAKLLLTFYRHMLPLIERNAQEMLRLMGYLARCKRVRSLDRDKREAPRRYVLATKIQRQASSGTVRAIAESFERALFREDRFVALRQAQYSLDLLFAYAGKAPSFPKVQQLLVKAIRRLVPVCPKMTKGVLDG